MFGGWLIPQTRIILHFRPTKNDINDTNISAEIETGRFHFLELSKKNLTILVKTDKE